MHLLRLVVCLSMAAAACSSAPPAAESVELIEVIDGDTVRVRIAGSAEDVRLVGLNTPERDECHAAEASAAIRSLLAHGQLSLGRAGSDDRDRFGRLLRYLHAGDTLVNLEMVRRGHGLAVAGDHELEGDFTTAVQSAWADRLGVWGPRACGDEEAPAVEVLAVEANPPGDDSDRPNEEFVVVGGFPAPVDLSGWTLRDESSSHRFEFPQGTVVAAGASITVHSGCGTGTTTALYWCEGPVWSNRGDTVVLQAANGNVADVLIYRDR